MRYAKPSQDADDDRVVSESLALAGIAVLSAAWGVGMLTIETDRPLPPELAQSLGLAAEQE